MIYSIKRFSQFIEEKLFSGKSKKPINIVKDVYMEGIKLVEMWRSFENRGKVGDYTLHWINRMADVIDKTGTGEEVLCYQLFFAPLDKNILKGEAGKLKKDYSKGRSPEKVMQDELDYVLNLKENGKFKYKEVIESQGGFSMTPKEYISFFKYIALSLSGQYNKGPWDDIGFLNRTNVDYQRNNKTFESPEKLQKFLEHLFVEYLGPNDFIQ